MSAEARLPLPTLHVRRSDGPGQAIIEFEEFSMWDGNMAQFHHPPREYRDAFIRWLEDRYDMYFVSFRGPYIYLRALAIPDVTVRPVKIAGRMVIWLSPTENPSITYAGVLQRKARRMPDPEEYESLIPFYLPEPRLLEVIMMDYFNLATAITYLGDHLVVEMPSPGNGVRLPIPPSYHRMRFQIPVSFTYGPLFEGQLINGQAAVYATNIQSSLFRIGSRVGMVASRFGQGGARQYNDNIFVPSLPAGYQNLVCQGIRVTRRDRYEPASETSQFWAYDIFATNQATRGRMRRSSSTDVLRRSSLDRALAQTPSSLSTTSTTSPTHSARPSVSMYIEDPMNPPLLNPSSGYGSTTNLPVIETPVGGEMSVFAYEQALMRRHFNFVPPSFYNDSTSAYDTSVVTL